MKRLTLLLLLLVIPAHAGSPKPFSAYPPPFPGQQPYPWVPPFPATSVPSVITQTELPIYHSYQPPITFFQQQSVVYYWWTVPGPICPTRPPTDASYIGKSEIDPKWRDTKKCP